MMAYATNELFQSGAGVGSGLRAFPDVVQPKTYATGSITLAKLSPTTFDTSLQKWILWAGGISQVNVITAASTTATDGTFTITVNGITTAVIDHDANAAAIDAALVAAGIGVTADFAVVDAGGGLAANNGTATITFAAQLGEQAMVVSADFALITGNVHVLSTSTTGVSNPVDGLVWPDAIVLDSSDDILGQTMLAGRVHVDDIPITSGRTLGSLKAALREGRARDAGFVVEGLDAFH